MLLRRSILEYPIARRRNTEQISIASVLDFSVGRGTQRLREDLPEAFPYCLDVARGRAVYVTGIDPKAIQQAPFYYLYARRNARTIVSVPWAAGRLSNAACAQAPVFLFSPGRVGSTLVSRILSAAGIASVSEPDFYTQMTSQMGTSRFNPLRSRVQKAVANLTRDLCAVLSRDCGPVIKLRAECCRAPQMFFDSTQPARAIFMVRDFASWLRSTGRNFRAGPRRAVRKYLQALQCYSYLSLHTDCHLIRYEDMVADAARACRNLGAFLGREISTGALTHAMETDSQQDTPLEQGSRPDRPGRQAAFDETMRLWNSAKLVELRRHLPLYEVGAD